MVKFYVKYLQNIRKIGVFANIFGWVATIDKVAKFDFCAKIADFKPTFKERNLHYLLGVIHLLCACIVIGYLVYDVVVFSFLRKKRDEASFKALKREILKPSVILLGSAFVGLLVSGFLLASLYVETQNGFFSGWYALLQNGFRGIYAWISVGDTLDFYAKLVLKLVVVSLLFVFTPISFFYILVLKKPDPMRRFYHHLALAICFVALLLARSLMG